MTTPDPAADGAEYDRRWLRRSHAVPTVPVGLGTMCSVSDAIERVIADSCRYSEAGEVLASRLHEQHRWSLDDIERLRSGVTLTESCRMADSASRSRELTRLLAEFEETRRVLRAATVLALLDEGMTVVEIGQVFGVSRQLANRLVKDAHAHYG